MSKEDIRLQYSRQDLRKASKFTEGEYSGINPREFIRSLRRRLEEIQDDGGFKYRTIGDQEEALSIESEEVGDSTGTVKGRMGAVSDEYDFGSGSIEYKPYAPYGALAIVVGLILAIPTVGLTLLLSLVGGYYYFKTERAEIPLKRQDIIRVLITGEVSERTIKEQEETRTDIFANMTVIYAGDSFVNVDIDAFEKLDWPHRTAIVRQVGKWHDRIVDEASQEEIEDGFIGDLKVWSNKDLQEDIRTVESIQHRLNDEFEYRMEYTDLLEDQLSREQMAEVEGHEDEILTELTGLADDMDVYVDREGMSKAK